MSDQPDSSPTPNPMKPSSMTAEQMAAITARHAELEQQGKYELLLETLCEDPIYEFHPPGGQLRGGDILRAFYVEFLENFMPLVEEVIFFGEWATPIACVHEYQLGLKIDGKMEYHQLMGAIYGSDDRIGGERLYGSERLIDLMLGSCKSKLIAIEGPSIFEVSRIKLPGRSR